MNYLLLAWLLWPWLRLLRLARPCRPGRRLLIQTAKIGDWINSTPVIRGLAPVDVLCAPGNLPLARHDQYIDQAWTLPARAGMAQKLVLAWQLFRQGYDEVFILMPNMPNAFLARLACARTTHMLDTYRTKARVRLLGAGFRRQTHRREDLVLDDYLRLAGLPVDAAARRKHATSPLFRPENPCSLPPAEFRVGISLAAGNRLKTLPMAVWRRLMEMLAPYRPAVCVFGLDDERPLLDELRTRLAGLEVELVDCLGQVALEALPWHIARMDLYISTDTGNSYMADSLDVPLVNFAGPCFMPEQRPLGEHALVVETPGLTPFSFIFAAPYSSDLSPEALYALGEREYERIGAFIADCHRAARARHSSPPSRSVPRPGDATLSPSAP